MNSSELFDAIQAGDLPSVQRAVEMDPELAQARNVGGVSAILWACYHRQGAIAARLAAGRQDLDAFDAVAVGDAAALEAVLGRDPSAARAVSADGFTALHFAAFFGRPALARRLLDAGADANAPARNAMKVTPLHSAVSARANDIAAALLERGADPNARQQEGWTALMSAATHGDEALAAMLLGHGADPGVPRDDGRVAADLAAEKGHADLAARLRAGAARLD